MKKLLVTREMPEGVLDQVQGEVEITQREKRTPMTAAEAKSALQKYDGILCTIGDRFNGEGFDVGSESRCKILVNFGVGYDHIDVFRAKAVGIKVTNTPDILTNSTADIAITLMLMAARRAVEGDRLVRSGEWKGWEPTQMLGTHISGKNVGIFGMGRIGKAIAHRCHYGFGMHVHYYNRSRVFGVGLPAWQVSDLEHLAKISDVLMVSVKGDLENRHSINKEILSKMKKNSILVNISRGDVVDEMALIDALQSGNIAAAGLDVYENEPKVPLALRKLDNMVLLPHLGSATMETRQEMGRVAVNNLNVFWSGALPPNIVDG